MEKNRMNNWRKKQKEAGKIQFTRWIFPKHKDKIDKFIKSLEKN